LGESLSSCYHVAKNVIYQVLSGNPSGNALTVVINTIVVQLMFLMAWRDNVSVEMQPFDKFLEHTRFVNYGDDLVCGVSLAVADDFNNLTIRKWFEYYGITVTSCHKGQQLPIFFPLDGWMFLKRSVTDHPTRPGKWLGAFPLESVFDTIQWMRKCPDEWSYIKDILTCAAYLVYTCGPKDYSDWCREVQNALKEKDCPIHIPFETWKDLDVKIMDEGFDVTRMENELFI